MSDKNSYNRCTQVHQLYSSNLAQNLLLEQSAEKVREYARRALSESTWRSYESDIVHFTACGGTIPASPEMVAAYLAGFAGTLAISTLSRRLAAINKIHEMQKHPSPTKSQIVRMTMKGIRREHSVKQKQSSALLRDDLIAILNHMPDNVRGVRDRAALMIGFAGALRRSELVALNIEDIEFVTEGLILYIHKSKTDQEGHGRKIAIPTGRTRHCPVRSVKLWIDTLSENKGPLFRPIRKGGTIQPNRLSDGAISCLIKEYVEKIDLDPTKYSGHALRAGCISSLAQMGIPDWQIMQKSGHKTHQSMMRYIRDARLFEDHPLDAMF